VREEEVVRVEDVWVRRHESWGKWWRRIRGEQKEFEIEEVDDGSTGKTGRAWWRGLRARRLGSQGAERRPLLDSNSNH
jgi:hypothetical protein